MQQHNIKKSFKHNSNPPSLEYSTTLSIILQSDNPDIHDILQSTANVLSFNYDLYSLWNIRKIHLLKINSLESYSKELSFTLDCLLKHPKSYCIWQHRLFILKHAPSLFNKELALVSKLLDSDQRNFHAWNYRFQILPFTSQSLDQELIYTYSKIFQNFSNYSAWHYRSILLVKIYPDSLDLSRASLDDLQLVRNAYYTEPNDQAPWFYHRFLMSIVPKSVWDEELTCVYDLLEIEPNCKWALLAICYLKKMMGTPIDASVYKQLSVIDPTRKGYYSAQELTSQA